MNTRILTTAIYRLNPQAQFTLLGDDLNDINWIETENPPKIEVILEEMKRVELLLTEEQAQLEIKRQAALNKLVALGLEPDDLKALGL